MQAPSTMDMLTRSCCYLIPSGLVLVAKGENRIGLLYPGEVCVRQGGGNFYSCLRAGWVFSCVSPHMKSTTPRKNVPVRAPYLAAVFLTTVLGQLPLCLAAARRGLGFVSGWPSHPIHRCSSTHGGFRPLSGSLGVAGQRRSMSKGPVDSHEVTQHATAQSSGFGMLEGEDASGVNGGKQSPLSIHWGVALTPESTGNQFSTTDVVSLNSIRSTLIRQEDSIIFSMIERAQFLQNRAIYMKGLLQVDRSTPDYDFLQNLSFLEYVLLETEKVHSKVRRYTSPEEHSFFPGHLPDPVLPPLRYPRLLAPNTVDVNAHILSRYISEIVPAVCKPGDDEQHGSSVLCDITALQAISKRIHLGKFVAETKFQEAEAEYRRLVLNDDVDGVMELLTNRAVEERVLQRAELKASTYGQDIGGETTACKVEPRVIAAIYRDMIIPLTKDVEVLYLFERVGRKPPASFKVGGTRLSV